MRLTRDDYCAIVGEVAPHLASADLESAALDLMGADDDCWWSLGIWAGPEYRDLRLAAVRARRERVDAVGQHIADIPGHEVRAEEG